MRLSRTVTADGSSLYSLLAHTTPSTNGILLLLAAGSVLYGTVEGQQFALTANREVMLPTTNTKSLYLSGGGTVHVALF